MTFKELEIQSKNSYGKKRPLTDKSILRGKNPAGDSTIMDSKLQYRTTVTKAASFRYNKDRP